MTVETNINSQTALGGGGYRTLPFALYYPHAFANGTPQIVVSLKDGGSDDSMGVMALPLPSTPEDRYYLQWRTVNSQAGVVRKADCVMIGRWK